MRQYSDCSCWHSFGFSLLSFPVSWAVQSRGVEPACVPLPAELCRAAEAQTFSSVSCYWHLSCRRRVLAVGFSIGVCCVPVSPNKILFKKQESFLPGLLLLLRVGQKEQGCVSCVLFRGRAGTCSVGFWGEPQQSVPSVRRHDTSRCNSCESTGCYTQEQPR